MSDWQAVNSRKTNSHAKYWNARSPKVGNNSLNCKGGQQDTWYVVWIFTIVETISNCFWGDLKCIKPNLDTLCTYTWHLKNKSRGQSTVHFIWRISYLTSYSNILLKKHFGNWEIGNIKSNLCILIHICMWM